MTFVQSNDSKLLGGISRPAPIDLHPKILEHRPTPHAKPSISRPWDAYASLADASQLPCRVFLTVGWQDVGAPGAPQAGQQHRSGLLSCDRAKLWTDGGLGAKTAAMLEPYADDPENSGVMQMTVKEIEEARVELLSCKGRSERAWRRIPLGWLLMTSKSDVKRT